MSGPTVAFAGTPQFAVPALRALLDAGFDVPLVLTQPDRRAGRGRRVTAGPVKVLALERRCAIEQPATLAKEAVPGHFPVPDLLVVAAYGLLLPRCWLDWPRVAPINIHASLLPRWRGAAPIQHAILAGDARTGISLMHMTPGLDEGPVYTQETTAIGAEETSAALHERLAALGADLLLAALPRILDGSLQPTPQDPAAASYAAKITKRQARLDWRRSAAELSREVRAFDPWPIAVGDLDDGRSLRIWRARALPGDPGGLPGTVVAVGPEGLDVATGDGRLRVERLQPPGAKPMAAQAYLNAHRALGARFVVPSNDER